MAADLKVNAGSTICNDKHVDCSQHMHDQERSFKHFLLQHT
jgi:hypothetical protein